MKKVRFPIYFEVVGYGELELPEEIYEKGEDHVKDYIESQWDELPLPPLGDVDYIADSCVFDRESIIKIVE